MIKENKIQNEIFMYYHNEYARHGKGLIFAIPNGGTRNIREAITLKATGVMAGASDMICILPNKQLIFLELKTEKGVQSEKQKEFQIKVNNLGYEYWLIRSLEEFKNKICLILK